MAWYIKDCHGAPMWYGLKFCRIRAKYATAMKQKREKKPAETSSSENKDFEISLAVMTSPDDFKDLQGNKQLK